MTRKILSTLYILLAGLSTYVCYEIAFKSPEPGDPDPGHPGAAFLFSLLAISLYALTMFCLWKQLKGWWIIAIAHIAAVSISIVSMMPIPGP